MRGYKRFSKVILTICLCGVILAIVNEGTGFINPSVQTGGTVICICGFVVAGITTVILENERIKKEKKK